MVGIKFASTLLVSLLGLIAWRLPIAHGAVHRIDVTHKLPSNVLPMHPRRTIPSPSSPTTLSPEEIQRHHHQAAVDFHSEALNRLALPSAASKVATNEPLNIDDWGLTVTGNVSLGTPAQTFLLKFPLYDPNLYVIDANANYYLWGISTGAVNDKQTFNSTASSTYTAISANFSHALAFTDGTVGKDVLQLGDQLSTPVTFELVSAVKVVEKITGYDGVFGLSSVQDANTSSTLLEMLRPSLDLPVFTYNLAYEKDTKHGKGQLTLGGLAPETCEGNWVPVKNSSGQMDYTYFLSFPTTSISATAVGDLTGCVLHADAVTGVTLTPLSGYTYVSYQAMEVFVQASGAKFNNGSGQYELTDEQLKAAQPVYLNLAIGGAIRMDPADYVAVDGNGVTYLNVWGYYDSHFFTEYNIVLGASFLNNHCVSKNFQTGVWSIANRVKGV